MRDPGSIWGIAVAVGTLLLGLALGYGAFQGARRKDEIQGQASARDRWQRIGAAALIVIGICVLSWWLFLRTPGVPG